MSQVYTKFLIDDHYGKKLCNDLIVRIIDLLFRVYSRLVNFSLVLSVLCTMETIVFVIAIQRLGMFGSGKVWRIVRDSPNQILFSL